MSHFQYNAVKSLFLDAIEIEPSLINNFLTKNCDDPFIIAEVKKLLKTYSSNKKNTKNIEKKVAQTVLQNILFFPNDRYILIKQIGHGGMGNVYMAQRNTENIEQIVAIKVLQYNDELSRQRFYQETKILSQLSHPNISQFIDADYLPDGRPYVVMEYIVGESITSHCKTLNTRNKINLFLQLCDAVKHAHRNLIIHQDIKPDNVLINKSNQVKLLDFGISKITDGSGLNTRTINRALTPGYASPEQLLGKPISVSSDVYSLGVVLYELLSDSRPFKLNGLSPIEIEKVLKSNKILKPRKKLSFSFKRERINKIDTDLINIMLKALDYDTKERYQTLDELIEDLICFQNNKPIKAGKKSIFYKLKKFCYRNKVYLLAITLLLTGIWSFVTTLIKKNTAIESQLATISSQRDDLLLEQLRSENIASTFTTIIHSDTDNNGMQDTVINESINLGNGNFFYSDEINLLGNPIKFIVFYNSKDAFQTRTGSLTNTIGKGWKHSFSKSLFVGNDDSTYASAYRPDGTTISFEKSNDSWQNKSDTKEILIKDNSSWIFINKLAEKEVYDIWGNLLEIRSEKQHLKIIWEQIAINTHPNSWSYKSKRRIKKLISDSGHFINFIYKNDQSTVIHAITDEVDRRWTLEYDLFYNLTVTRNPDGTGKTYLYDKERLPHAITAVGTMLYDGFSIFHKEYYYNDHKNRVTKIIYKSKICENETISINYCCGKRTVTNSKGEINEYDVKNNENHWELVKATLNFDYPKCSPTKLNTWRNYLIEQKLSH